MIKTLREFPVAPMTEETAKIMVAVMMIEPESELHKKFTEEQAKKLGFLGQVFYARLTAHKVDITLGLAVLLLSLMRTPGHAVLWTWTLFNMTDADATLTVEGWAESFPHGIPTDQSYEDAWDGQKGTGSAFGNMLDLAETWVRDDSAKDERFALTE